MTQGQATWNKGSPSGPASPPRSCPLLWLRIIPCTSSFCSCLQNGWSDQAEVVYIHNSNAVDELPVQRSVDLWDILESVRKCVMHEINRVTHCHTMSHNIKQCHTKCHTLPVQRSVEVSHSISQCHTISDTVSCHTISDTIKQYKKMSNATCAYIRWGVSQCHTISDTVRQCQTLPVHRLVDVWEQQ